MDAAEAARDPELPDEVSRWRSAVALRATASRPPPAAGAAPGPVELAIVVPCFNEAAVLPETVERLAVLLTSLVAEGLAAPSSTVWFVDDGSGDDTWELIEVAARIFPAVHGMKLSRNRGHQHALLAGLLTLQAGAVVTVDADLQDDLEAIREMLVKHSAGADVVYGVRRARSSDSWFKRTTAQGYYRVLARLGVDVVFDHADFRLLGARALSALRQYGEVNLFLRGIVPQLGFRTDRVVYDRAERFRGESKYPLRKMLSFALDGITSFSAAPLRFITARRVRGLAPRVRDGALGDRGQAGRDRGRSRLDLDRRPDRLPRRDPAPQPRGDRRVRREDLRRGEAPPALHRREDRLR